MYFFTRNKKKVLSKAISRIGLTATLAEIIFQTPCGFPLSLPPSGPEYLPKSRYLICIQDENKKEGDRGTEPAVFQEIKIVSILIASFIWLF